MNYQEISFPSITDLSAANITNINGIALAGKISANDLMEANKAMFFTAQHTNGTTHLCTIKVDGNAYTIVTSDDSDPVVTITHVGAPFEVSSALKQDGDRGWHPVSRPRPPLTFTGA
jgi:hypothetical protein